ncbi:TPA: hypothetical protein ACKQJM_003307 [Serratia marcescens]
MYQTKTVKKASKKYQDQDDIDVQRSLTQEVATSSIVRKRCFDQLNTVPGIEPLIVKKIKGAMYRDGGETVSSMRVPDTEVVNNELTVDDCVKLMPKDEMIDGSVLDYGVRLKMKYEHLLIKDVAERLDVNPKSLSGKIARKKKVLALDEQPKKTRDDGVKNEQVTIDEAVKELETAGVNKNDPNFGVYLRNRYPYLLIKNIAVHLGVKESTMKDRVYRAKLQGGVSKSLEMCMKEMPFDDDKYKDTVDYGIQLKNMYSHLFWGEVAQKLNVSKNTMKKRVQQKKEAEKVAAKSPDYYVSLQNLGHVVNVQGGASSGIIDSSTDSKPLTSTPVFLLPKKQIRGKLSESINDCIRNTPRGDEDSDDYVYAIRLKKKYHTTLTYPAIASHFCINKNTLMTKARKTEKNIEDYNSDKKVDIKECIRDTPRDEGENEDYGYAIRLKLKYNHLSYRALENEFPNISRTGLETRLKKYVADNNIKGKDALNLSQCVNTLVDEGMSRDSDDFGFHLKNRFPSLSVRGIARELGIKHSTLRQRIAKVEERTRKAENTLTLEECLEEMPFKEDTYADKYEYGILLQCKYSFLHLTKIAEKLGLNKDKILRQRGKMREVIEKGEKLLSLIPIRKKIKELKATFKLKKDVGEDVKSELRGMCRMVHEQLEKIIQDKSTTAVGIDASGKKFLASSDAYMNKTMKDWAHENGVVIAKGMGHAEEKMLRQFPDIVHIEVSRDICLECEIRLLESGVGTTTNFSGKFSQNAIRDIQKVASSSQTIL